MAPSPPPSPLIDLPSQAATLLSLLLLLLLLSVSRWLGFICSSADRNANFVQNGEMASLIFTVCPRANQTANSQTQPRVKQGKVTRTIANGQDSII